MVDTILLFLVDEVFVYLNTNVKQRLHDMGDERMDESNFVIRSKLTQCSSIYLFGFILFHLLYYCSGYARRIHELMIVSRELSVESSQPATGDINCFSEADYIEFSGVKV